MKVLLVLLVAACIAIAGCTTPTPLTRQTLSLNQTALFQNTNYAFSATITQLIVRNNGQSVVVGVNIQNTGSGPMTLAVYPELIDPVGTEYPGQEIFFSQMAPGRSITETGTIPLPAGTLATLGQGSTLHVRFQGTNPIPFEAYWACNFVNPS